MKYRILLLSLLSVLSSSATTILVDFGATTTGGSPTWNNFTSTAGGASLANLKDTSGADTTYTLTYNGTSTLNSVNDNNSSTVISATASPFNVSSVIIDSFFFASTQTFTLSGLNPSTSYSLTFYAYVNRTGTRLTDYTVNGSTVSIEPASTELGGKGGTATLSSLVPDASGNLVITVARGTGNSGNWILNGLAVNYTIPEPSSALFLSSAAILCFQRRRKSA